MIDDTQAEELMLPTIAFLRLIELSSNYYSSISVTVKETL